MRAHLPVACLLITAALAGCTTNPEPNDAPLANAPAALLPDVPAPITFTDCTQFHTMFTARAEDFQVPPGFTVPADETGLTTLYATPTTCADRAALVISVPVQPPPDRLLADHGHHYVIELYADENTTAWLDAGGISAVSCGCHLDLFTEAHPVFHMDGGGHSYTARFLMTASSGPFTEGPIVHFTGNGERAFVQGQGNATNLGIGDVVVQYTGPGGAPPLSVGNIAHGVHDLTFGWEVL